MENRPNYKSDKPFGLLDIIKNSKEIILSQENGEIKFHYITIILDFEKFLFKVRPTLTTADRVSDNFVKEMLALGLYLQVPIYPNSEKEAPILAEYYREMLIEGFEFEEGSGKKYRLANIHNILTNVGDIGKLDFYDKLDLVTISQPGGIFLLKQAIKDELDKLGHAQKIMTLLSLAIENLSKILDDTNRNERAIQNCLTENPVLFGYEYIKVIPKHKLGAEFEMDYALQRISGLVDLLEIEASTLRLFTQKGDPTTHLVHAEQQVLDWLEWIEKYSTYARDKLPGLYRPIGFVIIGRDETLSNMGREKLRQRNRFFGESLQIMTYDDLLTRAKALLGYLEGKGPIVMT